MRWTLNRRNPRGTILGMSLLLLSLLTSLGAGLLNVALNAHTGARHDIDSRRALALAEAGIAHARRLVAAELSTRDLSKRKDLSKHLERPKPPAPGEVPLAGFSDVKSLGLGNGSYSVWVQNNLEVYKNPRYPNDPSGAADRDEDTLIWLRSTGTYRNVSRTVRVLVQFPDLASVLDPPGAITLIDGAAPDKATLQSNAFTVDGKDTPAPTATGACGTRGASKYGISVNSDASYDSVANAAEKRKDNIKGAREPGSYANNGSISRAQLQSVANALIPQAKGLNDKTFPGTPEAPGIFVAKGDVRLTGNLSGYGILIVDGGLAKGAGTFQWEGLIIVLGDGNVDIRGTFDLYGALLVANTQNGATDLSIGGNGGAYYSSQALCRIQNMIQNMVPISTVIAWQQVG